MFSSFFRGLPKKESKKLCLSSSKQKRRSQKREKKDKEEEEEVHSHFGKKSPPPRLGDVVARALATTTKNDRFLPLLRVATFCPLYPGKQNMYTMQHATCQSITARTAALLATKRQLKNRRNASSVIVRAQEFIATDKAPAAAGPYSQGIKVRR